MMPVSAQHLVRNPMLLGNKAKASVLCESAITTNQRFPNAVICKWINSFMTSRPLRLNQLPKTTTLDTTNA